MAPPVHAEKLSHLFAFITIGHQAWARLLLYWIGRQLYREYLSKKCSSAQVWCHIVICKGSTKSGESYTIQNQIEDSEWPSFAALLHIINIPPAPWCIARCTLYFDTELHGILPWADINRNGNIFLIHMGSGDRKHHCPVDKNRSSTRGQSGLPYLLLWPQQEDSPDHANWVYKRSEFFLQNDQFF